MVILRVDDRYIHGQVTVSWVRAFKIREIWVVSDEIANDEFLSMIQKSSAPPGINVKILRLEEAIKELGQKQPTEKTLILVASPRDALELIKAGLKVDRIILGQMGYKEGRIRIEKTISVLREDIEALKTLSDLGIKIVYQQMASMKPKEIRVEELLKKIS
ncbi:MAG: PTS sugar transporter subunit IIB [Candidatus Njordarchaeales archaeon]